MRLISCHIDNFGKICNFNYEFNNTGLNTIIENNSWGKTTFAVFLKSMFYGLEYNTKRKNERKRYEPWQKGNYGGSIIIEIEDKLYRIERSFGSKDKEDTFKLVDLATGKESLDYGVNIGEEIFKIDRDSFSKTVYIPQCETNTIMTDSINAKIGNLEAVKDDINNFDCVIKRLEERKKEYTRNKSGKIAILKERAYELEAKVSLKKEKEESLTNLKKYVSNLRQQKDLYANHLIEINKLYNKATFYKFSQEEQNKYINYKNIFLKKTISKEYINGIKKDINRLREIEFYYSHLRKGDSEEDANDDEENVHYFSSFTMLKKMSFESDGMKDNESITEYIENVNFTINNLREKCNKKFPVVVYVIISMLLISTAICLNLIMTDTIISLALFAISILVILMCFCGNKRHKENFIFMLKQIEELEKEKMSLIKQRNNNKVVKECLNEMSEITANLDNAFSELGSEEFADYNKGIEDCYHIDNLGDFYERRFAFLESQIREYLQLKEKQNNKLSILKAVEEQVVLLEESINQNNQQKLFGMNNDVSELTLDEKIFYLEKYVSSIAESINRLERDIEYRYAELDELNYVENELTNCKSMLKECFEKAGLLEDTIKYLQIAKDNYASDYLSPIKEHFMKYIHYLNGLGNTDGANNTNDIDSINDTEDLVVQMQNNCFDIDIDLNVKVLAEAGTKSEEALSKGYRDLVGICARMAIIDIMYTNEKPILVFDDPFVNLDKYKIQNALELLRVISKEYQIIYFTCHPSRS